MPRSTPGGSTAVAADEPTSFNERLRSAIASTDSLLCVGLDPHPERLDEPAEDFCRRIIDQTIGAACVFKPNSAFFEAIGLDGLRALHTVIAHVGGERPIILDAKRGDIGSTARAYATSAFRNLGADAITVNPYLGRDAVAPFTADRRRGAFVLCHTSNPGAEDLQHLRVDGEPLYLHVARLARDWNAGDNVGLVVGATWPDAMAEIRALCPGLPFLVPGIGAQGGDLRAAIASGLDEDGAGMVINSSRGIMFADDPRDAALRLRDRIDDARAGSS